MFVRLKCKLVLCPLASPRPPQARDLTEGLMGQFLQFDFRNGSLRKKYDSLKYVLKNLENTLYELSLTSAGFRPSSAVAKEDAPAGEGKEGEADQ